MKAKRVLFGALSLILILSCEKYNDINEIGSYPENAKLKRISLYSSVDSEEPISIVEEYEYEGLDRVYKVSSPMYDDGQIVGTIKYDLYEYNVNGQLVKISNFNANTNSQTGFINLKNFVYSYSVDTLKVKELIEYPQINSFEYSLFKYFDNVLIQVEKYDNLDQLETYIRYEYNDMGELIKEVAYASDDVIFSVTNTTYSSGKTTLKEVYSGNQENKIREINKTYDSNGNLIMIESYELTPYSSLMSHVLRYDYYVD